jgi:hypothetical protein
MVAPEAGEAHGSAEFPRFGLLLTGDRKSALEMRLRFRSVWLRRYQGDFTSGSKDISLALCFLRRLHGGQRLGNVAPGLVELTQNRISTG